MSSQGHRFSGHGKRGSGYNRAKDCEFVQANRVIASDSIKSDSLTANNSALGVATASTLTATTINATNLNVTGTTGDFDLNCNDILQVAKLEHKGNVVSVAANSLLTPLMNAITKDDEHTVLSLAWAPGTRTTFTAPIYDGPDIDSGNVFRDRLKRVDIIGDTRKIIGMGYWHLAQTDGLGALLIFQDFNTQRVGLGQNVNIGIAGAVVTVTYTAQHTPLPPNGVAVAAPIRNPDFSELVAGDEIVWIDESGGRFARVIASVSGNAITLTQAPPAPGGGTFGYGFYVRPAVTVTATTGRLTGIDRLLLVGIEWNVTVAPGFGVGSKCAQMEYCSVIGAGLINRTNLSMHQPNSFENCILSVPAGSYIRGVFQSFVGTAFHTMIESNPYSLLVFSVFSGCNGGTGSSGPSGVTLGNGGQLCVAKDDFFNCATIACKLRSGHLNVQACNFRGNGTAVDMRAGSCMYSVTLPGFSLGGADTLAPVIGENAIGILSVGNCNAEITGVANGGNANTTTDIREGGLGGAATDDAFAAGASPGKWYDGANQSGSYFVTT